RLHLARLHTRRTAGVHQPVEYAAAGAGPVPRDSVRGESAQAGRGAPARLRFVTHPEGLPGQAQPLAEVIGCRVRHEVIVVVQARPRNGAWATFTRLKGRFFYPSGK